MASDFAIRLAAHQVRRGGVIAYPTDTVYGLGCDPLNIGALHTLNALKNRPVGKGLILLASNVNQLGEYIALSDIHTRKRLVAESSPTSWVVPAKKHLPVELTGGRDTIAVRITQSTVVRKLCEHLGHPLVSSSANPGGRPPARNSLQLHRWFHDRVTSILIDADAGTGKPSTLKHIHTYHIYRE
jgi:L-threonylcarbamoyladenylate synthase